MSQIPPQEDWSLALLNELQRAVPILEDQGFELQAASSGENSRGGSDDGSSETISSGSRDAYPRRRARGESNHGSSYEDSGGDTDPSCSSSLEAAEESLCQGSISREPAGFVAKAAAASMRWRGIEGGVDLLSHDAMALPMGTLTSGRRRLYPNKSTLQAHVCCVMDPLQVPHILETLRGTPQLASVWRWPLAYRIISPFGGDVHEGFDDDDDHGAGEKMLGLLKRMGLENLLLVVSRWDNGHALRLGGELFRCVIEQCKELLRELQVVARASFAPQDFFEPQAALSNVCSPEDGGSEDHTRPPSEQERGAAGSRTARSAPAAARRNEAAGGARACDVKTVDLDALGPAPAEADAPVPRRPPGKPLARRPALARPSVPEKTQLPRLIVTAPSVPEKTRHLGLSVNGTTSLAARHATARSRSNPLHRTARTADSVLKVARKNRVGTNFSGAGRVGTNSTIAGSSKAENLSEEELCRMTDEQLLSMCAKLRADRVRLEGVLTTFGDT